MTANNSQSARRAAWRELRSRPVGPLRSGVNKYRAASVVAELVEERILTINGKGVVSYAGS